VKGCLFGRDGEVQKVVLHDAAFGVRVQDLVLRFTVIEVPCLNSHLQNSFSLLDSEWTHLPIYHLKNKQNMIWIQSIYMVRISMLLLLLG